MGGAVALCPGYYATGITYVTP